MIGIKIIFCGSLLFVSFLEATRNIIDVPVMCPACQYNFTDTYEELSLRYLTNKIANPEDGSCEIGQKWIHYGADFGIKRNSCCCLIDGASKAPCTQGNKYHCPITPIVAFSDTVADVYQRIGRQYKNSVSHDCCCPRGFFKWTYAAAGTGTGSDISTCVKEIDYRPTGNTKFKPSS